MLASLLKHEQSNDQRYEPVEVEMLLDKDPRYRDSEDASSISRDRRFEKLEDRYRVRGRRLIWALGGLLFLTLLSVLLTGAFIMKRSSDIECGIQTSVWSPANPAVEYETINFDNAFAHESVYRGPPTPELEYAWQDLWFYGGIRIPEEKLPQLNRTFDMGDGRTLKPTEDGEGGVHALLEVFHQLHCLNLIRQYTWKDWYFRHPDKVRTPADFLDTPVASRMHVDHCIEALRISLMCHADTTPYLIMMDPTAPGGMRADFSPYHKCRKFDKLQNWANQSQMQVPPLVRWEPREEDLKP